MESGSFAVVRMIDDVNAVHFGTGSDLHTQMSFDVSGSYFDLDMVNLESGYAYNINILSIEDGVTYEHPETFKFRVE